DLFSEVNLTFGAERTGLIGQNGAGKTTLLEILSGKRSPFRGKIIQSGRIAYLPQTSSPPTGGSVARAIGIGQAVESLARIQCGIAASDELAKGDGLWGLKERVAACFSRLGVPHISIYQPVSTLSGGEFMRVRLAGLLEGDPDFVLLDEPTNHLDYSAREFV